MKRTVIPIALTLIICATVLVVAQTKRNNSVEAEIIAQEKRAFEAWKTKDKSYFLVTAIAESKALDRYGSFNREQWAQLIASPFCTVKNYELNNIKVTMLAPEVALLVYRFTHDTVCAGKAEPSPVWASTVYVKRGQQWLSAFHQETPTAQ